MFSENLSEPDSIKIEMCWTGYKLLVILQPTCTLLVLYSSLCLSVRCYVFVVSKGNMAVLYSGHCGVVLFGPVAR